VLRCGDGSAAARTVIGRGRLPALVDISGDFPGSPVTLGVAFVFRGEVIEHLAIRPVGG